MQRNLRTITGPALALLLAGTALAGTPTQKCESDKNKEAGKYGFCRQKAEAKYALTGDGTARTAALAKCGTKYGAKWPKIESKGGGMCPSSGDQAAIQQYLDTATTNVATALAGGTLPECAGDLLVCQGDLGTCTASLSTSQGNLTMCTGDLSTCTGDLGTCNGSLTTCGANLTSTQTSLTACTGTLGTCTASLSTSQANLTMCTGDLSTCTGDLGTCNGSLTTCGANLTSTQASLTACTGTLGTCNTTLTTCQNDLATCQAAAPQGQRLRTGQTQCWNAAGTVIPCAGTGHDGELQKGLARAYVDNGDGTITDTKTGLMWEKLSDDGSIHDRDTTYTWTNAFATKVAALNGGGGFAGYTDWRVPNRNELESLVNVGAVSPAVFPAFNTGCAPACTVLTCSCTASNNYYWSSSTYQLAPTNAWVVLFSVGIVSQDTKSKVFDVRAVRGGS